MRFQVLLLFLILSVVLLNDHATAQSLSDIQKIKVDQLSDDQVEQFLKRAEASGMTEQQLESLAIQRGMPAAEVEKLRKRINSIRSGRGSKKQQVESSGDEGRQLNEVSGENIFEGLDRTDKKQTPLTLEQQKLFGYKLFHNKTLDFSPNFNMATPKSYVVGPGDELLIEVYGASQQSYQLKVGPEGTVTIPMLGVVSVSGLSIEAATSKLKSKLSTIYATMQGSNPSSFAQITLGNIRTIKVNMVGELEKPGTYSLPSFATVFNALYAAGGPTTKGTFRAIEIYRGNKLASSVDIYDFLVKGQTSQNIRLEDNDFVIVQPSRIKVEITGEVRRPGIFEMKSNESLKDLLGYAGDFSAKAYRERITIRRRTETQQKMEDVTSDKYSSVSLMDGDELMVAASLELFENRVQLSGAVVRPGAYSLSPGLTVKGLLEKGGGPMGDAFTTRATLYRTRPDYTLAVQAIDLGGILNGKIADVELKKEDVLNVVSIYDLREELNVQIYGEVNRAGVYPYADGMTIEDLVTRAGGFKESAQGAVVEIARRPLEQGSGRIADILTVTVDKNLNTTSKGTILKPFDQVFIRPLPGYQNQQLVQISGEVKFPGPYAMDEVNMKVSDLIRRAGGLKEDAYVDGATLVRRTEFYKELSEPQRKDAERENLLNNLLRREELTESERAQLERLINFSDFTEKSTGDKEVQKSLLGVSEGEKEKSEMMLSERAEEFAADKEGAKKLSFRKETEMVGIDLKKIMSNPGSKFDIVLQEGDVLTIPKTLQTVRIRGEVLYPSTAVFEGRTDLMNYISRSGGFTDEAQKKKTYIVYPNGKVDRTRSLFLVKVYPKVTPGSEIYVPSKPQRERMNAQGWIGLATSISTLAIIIRTLL